MVLLEYLRLIFLFLVTFSSSVPHPEDSFQSELLRQGLKLSETHNAEFGKLYRGQFFKKVEEGKGKKKGKSRSKRAFWGLDKFFTDAVKTRDHFGGLKDRVGSLFGSDDTQVRHILSTAV